MYLQMYPFDKPVKKDSGCSFARLKIQKSNFLESTWFKLELQRIKWPELVPNTVFWGLKLQQTITLKSGTFFGLLFYCFDALA